MNNRRIFKGEVTIGELTDQFMKTGMTVAINGGRITEITDGNVVLKYKDNGCGSVTMQSVIPGSEKKKKKKFFFGRR